MVLHPGGANGVVLKSNAPLRCAYMDKHGLSFDGRKRFSVIIAWLINQTHRCIGNEDGRLARPAIKWLWKTSIAFSAGFVQ